MSRYRGPCLKITRRLGNLPGLTRKKVKTNSAEENSIKEKNKKRPRKQEYAIRLAEKQKLRYNYGLTEKQLLRCVRKARKFKGSTGQKLLELLETRLDNIVFRLRMAPTIRAARQLVSHGHITVNNKRINIPSYECKINDLIGVKNQENSRRLIKENLSSPALANVPDHLKFDNNKLEGKIEALIQRKWIALELNELLVVEYYSRKA
uniref:Ribosomal protein S4 n=1 Tax=Cyanoptyche gloeocystis TaxID=77922 RepID=A0A3G1IWE3_9EUKA|nr:ribosomal protein S4 [Cyanoptyche gloeocystis]